VLGEITVAQHPLVRHPARARARVCVDTRRCAHTLGCFQCKTVVRRVTLWGLWDGTLTLSLEVSKLHTHTQKNDKFETSDNMRACRSARRHPAMQSTLPPTWVLRYDHTHVTSSEEARHGAAS